MELVVEKSALKDAISLLAPSTKKKEGMITSCLLFEVEEGLLKMTASDRLVYTQTLLDENGGLVRAEGKARFTIEEARLSQWIGNVLGDEIQFAQEGNSITLSCGTFESPFTSQDPDRFTANAIYVKQFRDSELLFTTEVVTLLDALSFVKPFVSTREENNDPNGRLKVAQLRDKTLLGTDSRLLAIYDEPSLGDGFKVGHEQLGQVLSFLKRQNEGAPLEVRETDNIFFLKITDDNWFGFAKPSQDLPNMSSLPTDLIEPDVWEVDKSSLRSALGALQATAEATDVHLTTKLSGEGDNAILSMSMRAAKRDIPAHVDLRVNRTKSTDQDLEFICDINALTQVLGAYDGTVTIAYDTNSAYLKFHQKQDTGASKICLMTLRLA